MENIMEIKENNWDLGMFIEKLPIFINFLNKKGIKPKRIKK
jgi:hypothetical protein